jgi:hypothetical protein
MYAFFPLGDVSGCDVHGPPPTPTPLIWQATIYGLSERGLLTIPIIYNRR